MREKKEFVSAHWQYCCCCVCVWKFNGSFAARWSCFFYFWDLRNSICVTQLFDQFENTFEIVLLNKKFAHSGDRFNSVMSPVCKIIIHYMSQISIQSNIIDKNWACWPYWKFMLWKVEPKFWCVENMLKMIEGESVDRWIVIRTKFSLSNVHA